MPPSPAWRLIDTGPLDGPTNMAVDEALLNAFRPGISRPVLRLYGWRPAALSLGRFQKADEVLNLDLCRSEHLHVVRRITGGGIIYHDAELTYSLICSPGEVPAPSIKDSFRQLTGFLITFYRNLGLDPHYALDALPEGSVFGERTAFCFAGRESCDILISGRKIGGNAQRRLREVIFQHGSIPVRSVAGQGVRYLSQPLHDIATSLTSLLDSGITGSEDALRATLLRSFATERNTILHPDRLSEGEEARVEELVQGKYSREEWNLLGRETATRNE